MSRQKWRAICSVCGEAVPESTVNETFSTTDYMCPKHEFEAFGTEYCGIHRAESIATDEVDMTADHVSTVASKWSAANAENSIWRAA